MARKRKKRIRSVTHMPCFILKLQGLLDSRKGETVAAARIERMKDRCAAIENLECLEFEDRLFEVRMQASDSLACLSRSKKDAVRDPGEKAPANVHEMRAQSRREARRRGSEANAAEQLRKLYQYREILTRGETDLEERILKTRNKALVKIDAYVKGLRSGKLPGYEPDLTFSDAACSTYRAKHAAMREMIIKIASYGEETA